MVKRVLDVGNCAPDHASIRSLLSRTFDCEVVQAHGADDTLSALAGGRFDLVLVNRKLDRDYSDGIDVIRAMKESEAAAIVPVMLITNYANHQDEAEKAGALRGFGKLEFNRPETIARLATVLGEPREK